MTAFADPRIVLGRHCHGALRESFLMFGPDERVEVGSFCSIGPEVRLFGGGEHKVGVSSFPLRKLVFDPDGPNVEHVSKGPTRIGNDVSIGIRAMVLSGVTVGDGAIVGAGAVVARDVPPYAVVAGNPAQVIRMRFDERTVERLLAVRWWEWTDELIGERIDLFADVERLLTVAEGDRAP